MAHGRAHGTRQGWQPGRHEQDGDYAMVDIGVIIPCHNQGATLERAICSALDADEIIVIDDASPGGMFQYRHFSQHYPDVRLTHTRSEVPAGVCHARNQAISYTDTDLIIPLDADDALLPGAVKALRDAWKPGTFVYGDYIRIDPDGTETIVAAPPPGMITKKTITQATMCFSRADWLAVGGYSPDFNVGAEDWAFALSLVKAGIQPVKIDAVVYRYYVGDAGRAARCLQRAPIIMQLLSEHYGI